MPADPLSPWVYLSRNRGRTLPLVGVIVLAVLLIAGIVSLINSIPFSIKTIYKYSDQYLGVTPRGDASLTPVLASRIQKESPVPIDRMVTLRGSEIQVKSIVGPWPFAVLALEQGDMPYYIERQGGGRLDGRYPAAGAAEALVSEPLARNLGLKLGDNLMAPDNKDAFSPQPVKIVGILESPVWLALTSVEYYRANHFPPIDLLLVFARNRAEQDQLDDWATKTFLGENVRLFAFRQLESETDAMFTILYKILNVVIGTLVVVITMMMGMLINIYLSQRVQEFGLLQALGFTQRQILGRVFKETAIVVVGGWVLGMIVAALLLMLVKAILMDPRAFALDPFDRAAYLYTIPVPAAIFWVAFATIRRRFRSFDPVGVVERRLV